MESRQVMQGEPLVWDDLDAAHKRIYINLATIVVTTIFFKNEKETR